MQFLRKQYGLFENGKVTLLRLDDIKPNPAQPRRHFDKQGLAELADSIRQYGVLQPLTVRRTDDGFELVAGERRLRASKLAGLDEAPCLILGVDRKESSMLALVENLQRRDLDFIEEAQGIERLIRAFGLSQDEAARKLGKSQSAIANKLRLLRHSDDILTCIKDKGLTERHARALLRLEAEPERLAALDHIIRKGLNVAQTDEYIDRLVDEAGGSAHAAPRVRPLYIIKDVRLFLNSVNRAVDIMRGSGIDAQCLRLDGEREITITITIPRSRATG